MTIVNIDLADPSIPGIPATGGMDFVPTLRFIRATQVRLPELVYVRLVDGKAAPDLEPCDPSWLWRVTERVAGGSMRFISVPAGDPVDYAALPSIDLATLQAIPADLSAWQADVDAINTRINTLPRLIHGNGPPTGTAATGAAYLNDLTGELWENLP